MTMSRERITELWKKCSPNKSGRVKPGDLRECLNEIERLNKNLVGAHMEHAKSLSKIAALSSLSHDSRVAQLEKALGDVKELLRQIEHGETDAVIDAEVLARQARYEIEEALTTQPPVKDGGATPQAPTATEEN